MPYRGKNGDGLAFGLTRFLSWVSLILILVSSLMLAVFIGNSARQTLIVRQQQYALLLAENLNHQIYRRFTLPTYLTFGRIALRQPVQFERLDEVVQSTIHGLHVDTLRIYGADQVINYSLNLQELGQSDTVHPAISDVMHSGTPTFETLSNISLFESLFSISLEPKSFTLRTVFPLRVDLRSRDETGDSDSMITGVLEITQDITDDYDTAIRFQWLILVTCLGSAAMLFGLLQFFIIRAERALAERMTRTRKLEADLHQNEKLASMGRVIASIAHEIRNPLGIIRSSAELLLRRTDAIETSNKRLLSAMYDESCRLSQVVNDFLDYARPRLPKQEAVNITLVLEQALGFLEGEFTRSQVNLHKSLAPSLMVTGDKDLLYRAFYNIMSNALQAMEQGGDLTLTARRIELEEKTEEGVVTGNYVEVLFQDTGPGFSAESLPKLLDPFFTTKDHGTGLGLPIVNTIITGHGGTMALYNAPEGDGGDAEGAVVRVLLPARM